MPRGIYVSLREHFMAVKHFNPFLLHYLMKHLRLNIDNTNDPFAYNKLKTFATCKCETTDNNERNRCKWHFNKGKEGVPKEFRSYIE